MFEQAVRLKLRFPYKGLCTAEDLFDLTPTQLDGIFKVLNAERKAMSEDSLLATKNNDTDILDLKIEIVRHIVTVKLAEKAALAESRAKAEQRQKLLGILANKQDAELQGKSTEEIQAMIAAL